MKYKDKLVIIELPYPGFITTLCIMKTISLENDRSFIVNLEFQDNLEKCHVCKTKSGKTRSVDTDLEKLIMLVVALFNVDAYFFWLSHT